MSRKHILIITSLLILLSSWVLASPRSDAPPYRNPTGSEFPILAWYSILGSENLTPARFRELREAGFNLSFSHFQTGEDVRRALRAADGTGVKLLVVADSLYADPEGFIARFRGESGIAGWFLRDEPNADGFADIRRLRNRYYAADTTRLLYMNLLPDWVSPGQLKAFSYTDYLDRFLSEVDIPLISYDLYPVVNDGGAVAVRPSFFRNLESARNAARRSGRPFWAFALATAHTPYPVPTAAHLRFEAFSALAYGAQGLQYFTYWHPAGTQWDFHDSPIDSLGRRTAVYARVKALNEEIQALAPVFLGAECTSVAHVGALLPEGVQRLSQLPTPFTSLETSGSDVVVAKLQNGASRYLMLVSGSISETQTVTLRKSSAVERINSRGRAVRVGARSGVRFTLAPGEYHIYRY